MTEETKSSLTKDDWKKIKELSKEKKKKEGFINKKFTNKDILKTTKATVEIKKYNPNIWNERSLYFKKEWGGEYKL